MSNSKKVIINRDVPPPLCGHGEPLRFTGGYKAQCPVCGSFWDLDSLAAGVHYDKTYPAMRSHYDEKVGENKVRTLKAWLDKLAIDLSQMTVCEVGFGGGHCLKFLWDVSRKALGIETIDENIDHAVSLGISRYSLVNAQTLPEKLPAKVDLWVFSDSFEHLPDPDSFIYWMSRNSGRQAQLLIVAPEAGSLSDRLLGRLWPHKIHDHLFLWSRRGLVHFLSARNFELSASFNPSKYIAPITIASHLLQKLSAPKWVSERINVPILANFRFRFNIGEMGMLFRRRDGHN
jgi:methyltransferase family protein